MTRCRTDNLAYWSEQHKALLAFCAEKTLQMIPCHLVDIEELMSVGWYACLRRRTTDKLHGTATFVRRHMEKYVRYVQTGTSEYKRKRYGNPSTVSLWGEDGDISCNLETNDADPATIMEAVEEMLAGLSPSEKLRLLS